MSWTALSPTNKVTGRAMVTAYIRQWKRGNLSLILSLSQFVFDDLGAPERVSVDVGSDENAGKLKIIPDAEGPFKFSNALGGGKRLTLPVVPDAPQRPVGSAACKMTPQIDNDGRVEFIIIDLPIDQWRKPAATAPVPAPAPPVADKVAAAPASAVLADGKIDVIAYLTKKGHKVVRLAQGNFSVDGETWRPPEILALINGHRKQNALKPVTVGDLV